MTEKSPKGGRREPVLGAALLHVNPASQSPVLPTAGATGTDDFIMQLLGGNAAPGYAQLMTAIDKFVVARPHPSHGFIRVAAGSPETKVADNAFNAKGVVRMMRRAQRKRVHILVLPELVLSCYTAADLQQQEPLRRGSLAGLEAARLA
ncbi:MAG TPA: hypothetical protein V6C97_05390, partial [Oculatellaceae cyanobacterium]